jgi:hypothetical protein
VQGFVLAALAVGMLFAALVVGTTIALALWIAAVIITIAVIVRITFQQAARKRGPR